MHAPRFFESIHSTAWGGLWRRKQATSYILKHKDKVIAAYEKGSTTKRKTLKGPQKYQEIEIPLGLELSGLMFLRFRNGS